MFFRPLTIYLLVFLYSPGLAPGLEPVLRLAKIFQDQMVLQRGKRVPVWGHTKPNSKIMVHFGHQQQETISGEKGSWRVLLQPMEASRHGKSLTVESEGLVVTIKGVLVGDVWHASGQSNMAMNVGSVAARLDEARQDRERADLPSIRYCRLNAGQSKIALSDFSDIVTWQVCGPKTVGGFSATAFYFARRLHQELDVPIGVIDSSRGGTPIEPFIPRVAFGRHPTLRKELELGDKEDLSGIWSLPGGVRARDGNWLPGRLFHSRLAPLKRFPVKGLIWYQGESNCGDGEDPRDYRYKMQALIEGWRKEFGDPEMPCYFVQLPGSGARKDWPYLREQQRLSLSLPRTAMVVTIDLLDTDIHPANKLDVGKRLAQLALTETYGQAGTVCGPLFQRAELRKRKTGGQEYVVSFSHAGSGLTVARKTGTKPPQPAPELRLQHFELATADRNWFPASAKIVKNRVIVHSKKVNQPIAVRYAYAIDPQHCYLFNKEGFPASPFCSRPDLLMAEVDLPKDP